MAIDLISRIEGCGFNGASPPEETVWQPELRQTASDALQLRVAWNFEGASACGNCLHDFSIQAKGVAISGAGLLLSAATRACTDGCNWSEDSLTIPASAAKEGIRCRYTDWLLAGFAVQTYRGKAGGPAQSGQCDEPLVAAELDGETRCLKACDTHDNCDASLMRCVDSTCQLTEPW